MVLEPIDFIHMGVLLNRLLLIFLLFFVVMPALPAWSLPVVQPGFRTLGVWNPTTGVRLDLAIWYPTNRSPSSVDYGNWTFSASRGAPPLTGQHPLVLLSHDSAGSRFSLHQLATALVQKGFVVAAPTHLGDNIDNMSLLFTGEQLVQRARQLSATLDTLLSHSDTAPLIDPQRIGVLGIGPGGTAALLLAGARLDPTGWSSYCTRSPARSNDPYCSPWAKVRMDKLVATPGLEASFRDRRIRIAAAVAPTYCMLLTPNGLTRIRIPLLLLKAGKDRLNRPPSDAEALARALPHLTQFGILPEANAAALMSPCSENMAQTLPELCLSVTPKIRDTVQLRLAQYASTFFLRHLASPNPPPLPPEPEDPPEKETPIQKTKQITIQKRHR